MLICYCAKPAMMGSEVCRTCPRYLGQVNEGGIIPTEIKISPQIYETEIITCSVCNLVLEPGEKYYKNGKYYCKKHSIANIN